MKTQQEVLDELYLALKANREVHSLKDMAEKAAISYDSLWRATRTGVVNLSKKMQEKILRAFPMVNPRFLQKGEGGVFIPKEQMQIMGGEGNINIASHNNNRNDNEALMQALKVASKAQELNEQANSNLATLLQILKDKK